MEVYKILCFIQLYFHHVEVAIMYFDNRAHIIFIGLMINYLKLVNLYLYSKLHEFSLPPSTNIYNSQLKEEDTESQKSGTPKKHKS